MGLWVLFHIRKLAFVCLSAALSKIHNEKVYRYGVGSGVVWDSILKMSLLN